MEKTARRRLLMPRIRVLKEEVISKIAAGEVIERPASVLKELLENSVDAGAKSINISFEKAGRRLLRVQDDGAGMPPEDIPLAAVRHATSKLASFEELDQLATFGFRGEALYSVAAVSRLGITSCQSVPGSKGWTAEFTAGAMTSGHEAPPVPGTIVEVRDLFFNTPARDKFLKSDPHERSLLLRAFEESALANFSIAYSAAADGAEVYRLPAGKEFRSGMEERISAVIGRPRAKGLLYAESPSAALRIFLSPQDNLVAARSLQFFFVNRRPVASRILQQALYKGYETLRPKDKHPACVLYLELPPADFDVNIHPQKKDVRFRHESQIYALVSKTVAEALASAGPRPVYAAPAREQHIPAPAQQAAPPKVIDFVSESAPPASYSAPRPGAKQPEQPVIPQVAQHHIATAARFLGQIESSYLVFELDGGIAVIDQHAAQERVLYEMYTRQLESEQVPTQPLMLPVEVELNAAGIEHILSWQDWLQTAGFELKRFGPGTVAVSAAPAVLGLGDNALCQLVTQLSEVIGDPGKIALDIQRGTLALLACKKAVKAKDHIEPREAARLFEDLQKCRVPSACPHGRPTMFRLGGEELAKRFLRPGKP